MSFTLNLFFYPLTSSTTSIRADCSILLRGRQVIWSRSCVGMQMQGRQCNAMSSRLETTRQARYTHYMKERKQKAEQKKAAQRSKEKKEKEKKKANCRASPQGVWQTLTQDELNEDIAPRHINRVRLRTKGNNRQNEAQSTLQVAASSLLYEYTSRTARFSLQLIVGLVPLYSVCRLPPAFINYAPPTERMRQITTKAGSSCTHATRLLS